MTTPYSNISQVANATGSILGISKNLLGGPDSIMSAIAPNGLLGEVDELIKKGDTQRALSKLAQIRKMMTEIQAHAKEIQ